MRFDKKVLDMRLNVQIYMESKEDLNPQPQIEWVTVLRKSRPGIHTLGLFYKLSQELEHIG